MKKWVVTTDPMDIKRIIRKCCEQLCSEIELRKMEQFHYLLKIKCCCCLVAQSWLTLCNPMECSTPGFPVLHHLPKFAQVHVHGIGDFSNESAVIRWPKYWSFSFSISPTDEYSGLISIKIDWFDLFVVQGTLRSLLQHHSPKASILWFSAFFKVQLSQTYVTTGKTIASAIWTSVGRVMSLLFNTLSRCHSFPAKKRLSSDFIAVVTIHSDFRDKEKEICHYFHIFLFYLP